MRTGEAYPTPGSLEAPIGQEAQAKEGRDQKRRCQTIRDR